MARFDAIDLSKLPAPQVVEQLDFEAYLLQFKADFVARAEEAGWPYDVESLESDPVVKVLEVAAYRETILRQRVNDAARAVMLAFGLDGDLENLGALYKTARDVGEDIERYRARVQGAPEALSTCGNEGAYVHHAMRASTLVKDVQVWTVPGSGVVHVLPLSSVGNGTPTPELLQLVRDHVKPDGINKGPLTDQVVVRAPTVTPYAISLRLLVKRGPDTGTILTSARRLVTAYAAERHRVGETVYLNGILAAAKVGGVEDVVPNSPLQTLVPAYDQAFFCTGVTLSIETL